MANDLRLEVILSAINKATAPLKQIRRGAEQTANAMRATRGQLRALNDQQRDLTAYRRTQTALNKTQRALRDYQGGTERASQKVRTLTQRQEQQQRTLRDLGRKLDAAGIQKDNAAQAAYQLHQRERQLNTTLGQQQQQLRQLADKQKRLNQLRERHGREMRRVAMTAGVGVGALALGQRGIAAAGRLIAPGIDWEQQMDTLAAVGRFSAADPHLAGLMAQSRELGASTAYSATEVGAGQEFLLRAGLSAEAIQASMRDVLSLALANNVELARAADISSNIASGFRIDPNVAGNMARVADVLTATASRANVDLEMLGDTMKYLGAGSGLGLSLDQAAAMAGLLGNIGIQGSQAGTTLRAMMTRLSNPVGRATDSIDALNLSLTDAQGDLRAIPEILADISRATAEMGNAEQAAHLQNIFGTEAGSGMAELVRQQGSAGIDGLIQAINAAQGQNARAAATMADNAAGDLKALRSAWEEVGIAIADTNNGPLRQLIQRLTDITRQVGDWIKQHPQAVTVIGKLAVALAAGVLVLGSLATAIASVIGPMLILRFMLARNTLQLLGFGRAITFLATNPLGWILAAIAAVAAAAYLIYKHWDGISDWFATLWAGIKAAFASGLEALGSLWQGARQLFLNGLNAIADLFLNWSPLALLWRGITAALEALGVRVPEGFRRLGSAVIDGLIGGIRAKLDAAKAAIQGVADSVSGWFKDVLGIQSPSRVFARHGQHTLAGYQQGLAQRQGDTLKQVNRFGQRLRQAGAGLSLAAALPVAAGVALDGRAPLSAASGTTFTQVNHIHIHAQPGQSADQIAREVERILNQQAQRAQVRQRSALRDTD